MRAGDPDREKIYKIFRFLYLVEKLIFLISGFLALKFLSNTADRLRILSKSPKI